MSAAVELFPEAGRLARLRSIAGELGVPFHLEAAHPATVPAAPHQQGA